MSDWTGITGNIAKFMLGFTSIAFDTAFMLQHFVWYAETGVNDLSQSDASRSLL
jgi:hypothetical protein